MAHPIRTSKTVEVVRPVVPGGPSGNDDMTPIAKSLVSASIRTAWARWRTVSPKFQRRRLLRRSRVTPVAVAVVAAAGMGHPSMLIGRGEVARARSQSTSREQGAQSSGAER